MTLGDNISSNHTGGYYEVKKGIEVGLNPTGCEGFSAGLGDYKSKQSRRKISIKGKARESAKTKKVPLNVLEEGNDGIRNHGSMGKCGLVDLVVGVGETSSEVSDKSLPVNENLSTVLARKDRCQQ